MNSQTCRCCNNPHLTRLIDFGPQPVVHHLLDTRDKKFEKYSFVLAMCDLCGLIQLEQSFPPDLFYRNYFTLSSWKSQPHARYLIEVIERLFGTLRGRHIMEIGCNDGSFLDLLSAAIDDPKTSSSIIAFEPSLDAFNVAASKGYNVKNEFFGAQVVADSHFDEKFDLVISRQVFEHIEHPSDFLHGISLALKPEGMLVLEVPNFQQNLQNFDYTLWEEHVSYFTLNSLKECLSRNGFRVLHHEVSLFAGSVLTVFAQKTISGGPIYTKSGMVDTVERESIRLYAESYPIFKQQFADFLRKTSEFEHLLYGCGARSCFFANNFLSNVNFKFIDDREEKVGKIAPGCMAPIIPWDEEFRSKFILLGVNSETEHTVISKRRLRAGSYCSILPPSLHLPVFWKHFEAAL